MHLLLAAGVQVVKILNSPLPVTVVHSPLRVFVTNTPEAIKWTDVGMFYATLTLAIVTALLFNATRNMALQTKVLAQQTADMASKTADLATDTVDASNRADEHHQQSLWPLVVVSDLNNQGPASCGVMLHNIGNGPAQKVEVVTTAFDYRIVPQVSVPVRPLEAGDKQPVTVLFFPPDDPRRAHPPADVESFVFEVRYTSIFGTHGLTRWSWSHRDRTFINFDQVQHPEIQRRQRA